MKKRIIVGLLCGLCILGSFGEVKANAEFRYNPDSKLSRQEQIDEYNNILKKYGEDFKHEFGWTKSVIVNPNDRKLITLVKECHLEDFFAPLYKIAC